MIKGWVCNIKTKEVYTGYVDIMINNIMDELGLTKKQAEAVLMVTNEQEPLWLSDEYMWVEVT